MARTTPYDFGAGTFGTAAEVFKQITVDSEAAEARQAIAVTRERIKGAVQMGNDNMPDPDGFHADTNNAVKSIHDNAIAALGSQRTKALTAAGLAPILIDAQNDVNHIFRQKQVLKGRAAIGGTLEVLERELAGAVTPADIQAKETEIVNTMNLGTQSGFYSYDEARQKVQSIKEKDSFRRGVQALRHTSDPMGTLANIGKMLPNIDPDKTIALLGLAQSQQRKLDEQTERERKQIKEQAVLNDTMIALSGVPPPAGQFERNARHFGYSADEYRTVLRAAEEGGVTDPNEYTRLETAIRQGRMADYSTIAANPKLDRQAKSTLMGLVNQQKQEGEDRHFSKTPEYQEAAKELRLAVSGKGQLESLSEPEQQRYLSGLKELWNRAAKGEPPMVISRELQTRMPKEAVNNNKPTFFPMYQSEQELANALATGKIDRQRFNTEAKRLKDWQEYNKAQTQPPPTPQSGRQRR